MKLYKRRILRSLGILFIVYLGAVAYDVSYGTPPAPHQSVVQADSVGGSVQPVVTIPTIQEPALKALAADLQVNVSQLNLDYEVFDDSQLLAQFTQTSGVGTITYTIHVRPGQTGNNARIAFAHEYYHYIWLTHPEVRNIAPELRGMYAVDTGMHSRMKYYLKDGMDSNSEEFSNELLAIYCSETLTSSLPQDVQHTCLQWEDLGKITALRSSL